MSVELAPHRLRMRRQAQILQRRACATILVVVLQFVVVGSPHVWAEDQADAQWAPIAEQQDINRAIRERIVNALVAAFNGDPASVADTADSFTRSYAMSLRDAALYLPWPMGFAFGRGQTSTVKLSGNHCFLPGDVAILISLRRGYSAAELQAMSPVEAVTAVLSTGPALAELQHFFMYWRIDSVQEVGSPMLRLFFERQYDDSVRPDLLVDRVGSRVIHAVHGRPSPASPERPEPVAVATLESGDWRINLWLGLFTMYLADIHGVKLEVRAPIDAGSPEAAALFLTFAESHLSVESSRFEPELRYPLLEPRPNHSYPYCSELKTIWNYQ
jgi:hypothetical protein